MREPKSDTGSDSKARPAASYRDDPHCRLGGTPGPTVAVILRLLRPAYELRKSDQVDPDARDPRLAQAVEALRRGCGCLPLEFGHGSGRSLARAGSRFREV